MSLDSASLQLSAQRALLFCITPSVRFISVAVTHERILNMLVYVKNQLSEDESDLLYAAAGEMCGDFIELDDSEVEVVVNNSSYDQLSHLKHLVFALAETKPEALARPKA